MKVLLAGYNIDKSLIDKYVRNEVATPEVISAAYARISRSTKSVDELRKNALSELEKARTSNQSIIFDMGHSSIAEHAVFNIDLIGVSRYITEHIQKSRLASFTEKSQRYVTFERDYVIPEELEGELKDQYITFMDKLFLEYKLTLEEIKVTQANPSLKKRDLENLAKEDARYILPLATKTQMGITINARSLESLLRRLACLHNSEAQLLYTKMKDLVCKVSPSLVKYTEADCFYQKSFGDDIALEESSESIPVKVLCSSETPDDTVLTGLLYQNSTWGFKDILKHVTQLSQEQKAQIYSDVFSGIKSWHKLPKAFELADFTMEFVMSESCWSQFKRHRLCTILKQSVSPQLGHEIPPAVLAAGRKTAWEKLFAQSDALSNKMTGTYASVKPYLRTNSTKVRVVVKMNLREMYHFARLRSDEHAQWEIRDLSRTLVPILKTLAPLSTLYLMGKSEFDVQTQSD